MTQFVFNAMRSREIYPIFDLDMDEFPFAYEQLLAHEAGIIKEDWILKLYDEEMVFTK